MAYRRPLLREILLSFNLREGCLPLAAFFRLVPRLQDLGYPQVEIGTMPLQPGVEQPGTTIIQALAPSVRCWAEDRTRLVQVAQDKMVVNHVVGDKGSYLGWETFLKVVHEAIAAFTRSVGTFQTERVELGTIDDLVVPRSSFHLGRYLSCGGKKLPRWYHEASQACDISMGLGFLKVDGFNTRFKIQVRHSDDAIRINIESFFNQSLSATDHLEQVLETLHRRSSEHFEDLITDHTRQEVMGGSK